VLFAADELPGAALQRIYAYCLDGIETRRAGRIHYEYASLALMHWLDEFKTRSFAVATDVIKGHDVHLGASSEVLRWLGRAASRFSISASRRSQRIQFWH